MDDLVQNRILYVMKYFEKNVDILVHHGWFTMLSARPRFVGQRQGHCENLMVTNFTIDIDNIQITCYKYWT